MMMMMIRQIESTGRLSAKGYLEMSDCFVLEVKGLSTAWIGVSVWR